MVPLPGVTAMHLLSRELSAERMALEAADRVAALQACLLARTYTEPCSVSGGLP
jgi:hypothetical protein